MKDKTSDELRGIKASVIPTKGLLSEIQCRYLLAGILILTIITYSASLWNGIVLFDDSGYLLENPYIRDFSLRGIWAIFTTFHGGNYHPLTTLGWLVEYRICGLEPFSYHFLNLLLHLINVILVFSLLKKLTKSTLIPVLVAAFFAIHPMNVESVAWISERKNVLYTLFFLAGLIQYIRFIVENGKNIHLIFAFGLFILSGLSKSAAVVFPLVLPLIDYYFGRRFTVRSLLEKLPFFAFSVLFGVLAIFSQDAQMDQLFAPYYPPLQRLFIVFYGIGYYLFKLFIPTNLSIIHVFPMKNNAGIITPVIYASLPAVLLAFSLLLMLKKQRKIIIFGLLFYMINLLLVLQIIPVGRAIVADRYTYVPYLGPLFILAVFAEKGISYFNSGRFKKFLPFTVIVAIIIFFSCLSFIRTFAWKDQLSLFVDISLKAPDIPEGIGLGSKPVRFGDKAKAIAVLDKAISKHPACGLYDTRGQIYASMRNFKRAKDDFNMAIKLDSTQSLPWFNRGILYSNHGNIPQSVPDLRRAVNLKPWTIDALEYFACNLYITGQLTESVGYYSVLIFKDPKSPMLRYNRGMIYSKLGAVEKACEDLKIAADEGDQPSIEAMKTICVKE